MAQGAVGLASDAHLHNIGVLFWPLAEQAHGSSLAALRIYVTIHGTGTPLHRDTSIQCQDAPNNTSDT